MGISRASERRRAKNLLPGFEVKAPQKAISTQEHELRYWERLVVCSGLDVSVVPRCEQGVLVLSVSAVSLSLILLTPLPLVLVAALLLCGVVCLQSKAQKRIVAFERDYAAFLLSLASSVKTGLDPFVAFVGLAKLFEPKSEIGRELKNAKVSLERGVREEEVLKEFGGTIPHPDIDLFRVAFLLSRREGASLAPVLHRLAKVTRGRQSFRRRIRGAVAMQKLSAFGIAGCALLIASIQALGNAQGIAMALASPVGKTLLIGGGASIVAGVVIMLRMTRVKV